MRLDRETALLVCLCLWIPVAQSSEHLAPQDQDGSGDDEDFSGSGSGDDGNWIFEPEVTTQESPNTTKMTWFTDAPVGLPEHPVTQFVTVDPEPEPEASGHITNASFPHTTQSTETQPSTIVIIKSFDSVKDQKGDETSTVSDVAQPKTTVSTTVLPAEKLPVIPTHEEEFTTAAYDEENFGKSSASDEEEEVLVEVVTVVNKTPVRETTTLSTTSASNLADTETSGDAVESTTVQDNFIERNIFPEFREPNLEKPTMTDDFKFVTEDNEIDFVDPRTKSSFALGSASENDSLLERKEVLAGVIAGGVVGLAFAIMLVALMVYRMKKKDEGSYSLDEHKHPNGGYQKPQKQEEFLA